MKKINDQWNRKKTRDVIEENISKIQKDLNLLPE